VGLQDPSDLDVASLPNLSNLNLERDVRPELIIIIIISDFTLQIKSMFFFNYNNIFFKFISYHINNINYNNINNIIKLV
jgi:hypothetical protein